MAETLIMGNALSRFTNPERLIFGAENKQTFFNLLKDLNVKFLFDLKRSRDG